MCLSEILEYIALINLVYATIKFIASKLVYEPIDIKEFKYNIRKLSVLGVLDDINENYTYESYEKLIALVYNIKQLSTSLKLWGDIRITLLRLYKHAGIIQEIILSNPQHASDLSLDKRDFGNIRASREKIISLLWELVCISNNRKCHRKCIKKYTVIATLILLLFFILVGTIAFYMFTMPQLVVCGR